MNCKDFRDIADSYLSNELLVETNHDVLRHLESCRDCRELLGVRREIRERLRTAVKNTEDSTIDPSFAVKLRSALRNEAVRPRAAISGFRFAFAGVSAVVLVAIGAFVLNISKGKDHSVVELKLTPPSIANTKLSNEPFKPIPAMLVETTGDAIDDHKNCALKHNLAEKPISLQEAAKNVDVVNANFDKLVAAALKVPFGNEAKLVKAHYCLINGRFFTHVVLESKKKIFSVLLTKLDGREVVNYDPAMCGERDGLFTACFASNGYALFVVSDGAVDENLTIARAILGPVREHLRKGRISI